MTDDEHRRPILARVAAPIPGSPGDSVRMLNVSGGCGMFTSEILTARPRLLEFLLELSFG